MVLTAERSRSIGALFATVALVGVFLFSGITKLNGTSPMADRFLYWGYPHWFLLVAGAAEVLGAVLLAIPRTAFYGALALGALMAGALFTHFRHAEWFAALFVVIVALLLAMVGSYRFRQTRTRTSGDRQEIPTGRE